jgi:hypothetical protein
MTARFPAISERVGSFNGPEFTAKTIGLSNCAGMAAALELLDAKRYMTI